MAMLEQFRRIDRELVTSPITTLKIKQAIELSKELDKMAAEPTEKLDVEALLAEPTEFIREGEYLENMLDDFLNNDDLLDDLQDDSVTIATVGIIPLNLLIGIVILGTWREM